MAFSPTKRWPQAQEYWPLDLLEALQTQQINIQDLKYVLVYSVVKDPGQFSITIHRKFFAARGAASWAQENKTKNQRLWIPPSLYN